MGTRRNKRRQRRKSLRQKGGLCSGLCSGLRGGLCSGLRGGLRGGGQGSSIPAAGSLGGIAAGRLANAAPPAVNEHYPNIPGIFPNSPLAAPALAAVPRFIEVQNRAHLRSLTNRSLENVSHIFLSYVTNDDIDYIVGISAALTSITMFDLASYTGTGHMADTIMLMEAISRLTTLTSLSLSSIGIDDIAARALAESLPHLPALKSLNLSGNSIGAEGCAVIVQGIERCPTLVTLELPGNQIGNEGCVALCQSRIFFEQLRHINITNNHIGNEGFTVLAAALPTTVVLRFLDLYGNELSPELRRAITRARHNGRPIKIEFDEPEY